MCYTIILVKKRKKIKKHCYTRIGNRSRQWGKAKQLLHSPTLCVPVPSLHLSLCSSLMLKDSICFSSTPDHAHCTGTQGRSVMTSTYFSSQSIKLRASTDIPGMHRILQSISIFLPLLLVRGNNSTTSLVIRSHLSLLQPLGFHWILDQWGFGPGSHNANE